MPSLKNRWARIPVCFPVVPLRKCNNPEKETDAYFQSKLRLKMNGIAPPAGVQIRINAKSGRGVFLDYYGMTIYDYIGVLKNWIGAYKAKGDSCAYYENQYRQYTKLFKTSYRLAYCILIEDLTLNEPMSSDLRKKGIDLFGTKNRFDLWLSTPNFGLNGKTPRKVLATGLGGIERVNNVLTELEPWTETELRFKFSR